MLLLQLRRLAGARIAENRLRIMRLNGNFELRRDRTRREGQDGERRGRDRTERDRDVRDRDMRDREVRCCTGSFDATPARNG
jgi:hypothetical protein